MPCYHPQQALARKGGGATMSASQAWVDRPRVTIRCGQCIGCRMDKAQEWSTRIYHEAQLHEENSFITLTYSDDYMPLLGTLVPRDLQLFFKRLRKAKGPVRFFACGEYGEQTQRPHYHAILFGQAFTSDRKLWRRSATGHPLWRSELLEKLWPFGHSEIGSVTQESAGYVARYCLKKVSASSDHYEKAYQRVVPETGEVRLVHPEFARMSNRPGVGLAWFKQFGGDAFPHDFVVVDGSKRPVPSYYFRKLKEERNAEGLNIVDDPETLDIYVNRKQSGMVHADNNTPARLAVREEVQQRRVELLKRGKVE